MRRSLRARRRIGQKKAPKKDIAIQLYSVRDLIGSFGQNQHDYKKVLKDLADMGYSSVEAASYNDGKFYGQTPEQFKADVEAVGMKVLSSHCTRNLSDEELASGDFSESMKMVGSVHRSPQGRRHGVHRDPLDALPQIAQGVAGLLRLPQRDREEVPGSRNQIRLPQPRPRIPEDRGQGCHAGLHDRQNTDPENVLFEMDVYWAVIGQNSPVDLFHKYPGRFKMLHIKDRREIGQSGMVGFDAIFENAKTAGVENIIVEVEQYSYDVEKSVKLSLDYLLEAPFVKASYSK